MKKNLFIGTSGWSYAHWNKVFYTDIKPEDHLPFYSKYFDTVEINSTFYHTAPSNKTVKNWHKQVPKSFLFAVKANRFITHRKRLHDCKDALRSFVKEIKHLKEKLGPILFQLPPTFQKNIERLRAFIELLKPRRLDYVFEFRHSSWFDDEVYMLLEQAGIGLCITDVTGTLSPSVVTADFAYVRLHGPKKTYRGAYGEKRLTEWKKTISEWLRKDKKVYVYFDNDEKGYAIQDAKTLKRLLKQV
jgi:uncharacterized protein YecE (DUF72 family)